jgi:UDP-2-acetamido-2,6-beta-L-arabino-hexul-4-ose reductase
VRILVTGSNGFIGKNLLVHLGLRGDATVLPVTRATSVRELAAAAREADFVFHLAGVNRPKEVAEFQAGNEGFTQALCTVLQKGGRPVPVVYSSSIQTERDNPYGASKLRAEEALQRYSQASGAPVYLYRLPNVFGKWCRPNYNSVVATFCHNIANGLPIQVNDGTTVLSLVYIDDVIEPFLRVMDGKDSASPWPQVQPVYQIALGDLAKMISGFMASRSSLVSDLVGTGLTRALYATFVSYLPTASFSYPVPSYLDPRGTFVEMLKTPGAGQFSYFTAHPGVTRGGHYHHTKTEKFLVISGQARFRFRHILTDAIHELMVSGDQPQIVDTVPGWAHDITNVGSGELVVMLWANEIFDRARPDTYPHRV